MSYLISFIFFGFLSYAQATCTIATSDGKAAPAMGDIFSQVLGKQNQCPQNIDELGKILNSFMDNRKFLVGNRGRNNPKLGSFSIFESFASTGRAADAGIFLGHFTQLNSSSGKTVIDLDQASQKGKLVIELIAWDQTKGYYNFYELIGMGTYSQWFYRGDSRDILVDNQAIYLNDSPQKPPIGQTLRCSGCHISGGPIMKELAFPHNDWWTKSRPLIFEQQQSDSFLQRLRSIDTAENFSTQVKHGILKLETSPNYQAIKRSMGVAAQLRPIFCELEVNIESDLNPLESAGPVQIPSSSIAGPFSGPFVFPVSKPAYLAMLQKFNMQFPETKNPDADHAWLAPVKGYSDLVAIGALKTAGLVDDKTVLDIHLSAPIGSLMNRERCQLLKLVPNTPNWKPLFLERLKSQKSAVAKNMYAKMTNPSLNVPAYQKAMDEWYRQTIQKLKHGEVEPFFKQLLINRASVFESEISKNPRGQILEPGFRVVFPVATKGGFR